MSRWGPLQHLGGTWVHGEAAQEALRTFQTLGCEILLLPFPPPFFPSLSITSSESWDQSKPIYLKPGREEEGEIRLPGQRFISHKVPGAQRVC